MIIRSDWLRHSPFEGEKSYAFVQIELCRKLCYFNTASESLMDRPGRTAGARCCPLHTTLCANCSLNRAAQE